ncbi:MAG: DUF4136 domain-containing protein [Gammaproteobacteria bacterium]|nr:DUF4136 domain-containing protein [Gammaproteobacteria bacterium]
MIKALQLLSIVSILGACSTTKLVDHWQAETFSRNDLNQVLIVGVTNNAANRFLFESEIERAMLNAGLSGTTSIRALGDEFPTKENVQGYINDHDIDYVLATRLADVKVDKTYVPESVRTYYTGPYYPSYGHYYHGYGSSITMVRDAYVDTRSTVVLVTTIFDTRTKQPVWVGRSESFEPGSVNYLAADIAKSAWRNISP